MEIDRRTTVTKIVTRKKNTRERKEGNRVWKKTLNRQKKDREKERRRKSNKTPTTPPRSEKKKGNNNNNNNKWMGENRENDAGKQRR